MDFFRYPIPGSLVVSAATEKMKGLPLENGMKKAEFGGSIFFWDFRDVFSYQAAMVLYQFYLWEQMLSL